MCPAEFVRRSRQQASDSRCPFCRWLPSWLRPLPPSTSSCTLWAMRTTEEASGSSSLGKRSKCLKLRTSPNKWSIQLLPSLTALVVFSQVFRLVLGVWVCMCVLSVQWYFKNTADRLMNQAQISVTRIFVFNGRSVCRAVSVRNKTKRKVGHTNWYKGLNTFLQWAESDFCSKLSLFTSQHVG